MNKPLRLISLVLISWLGLVCLCLPQTAYQKQNSAYSHLIHVTVSDEKKKSIVEGLPKEAFTVFSEDEKQDITFFAGQHVPTSIGLVIDASGSMQSHKDKVTTIQTALLKFVSQGHSSNNYFVMSFQEEPRLLADWTKNIETIKTALNQAVARPKRRGSLFDTCYEAVKKLMQGKVTTAKRVIFLISDGEDSYSKKSFEDLKKLLRQSEVMIYSLGVRDFFYEPLTGFGREVLEELARISGGKSYIPTQSKKFDEAVQEISLELQNQYTIGFNPIISDNKYHKIKVIVSPSPVQEVSTKDSTTQNMKLKARTREGYFAK
ncbi:MAG: VWA domain-containing protein [Acidobacteriota bacterium]